MDSTIPLGIGFDGSVVWQLVGQSFLFFILNSASTTVSDTTSSPLCMACVATGIVLFMRWL